ncbi:hypothetical protein LTR37_001851 [Vermiconidia calcicola]|uniref:Uncharacterized protein n=1 Tax=Vermiconidia calcicola TaxID=1690605 RepID=A0ACC3NU54_9PEZI|nr:hypothetical protein LTR37_001851 [Vermiconidia calcicola]
MKTSTFAASAACLFSYGAAQQFVMYTPGGDDTSVQRADPIISPGELSQHVHQIFGADGFSPSLSYESLQESSCTTVGDAQGNGNAADLSSYWHPALYMEAKDGSGYIKVPTGGHKFYYKNAGSGKAREPFEFPHGFQMIAGNPFMRGPDADAQRQNITQWICHSSNGMNQGTDGGFPTGVTDCDAYPGFNGAIHFPHCWNGKEFNPAKPTAHMVYPTGDIQNGECPSSHPTRLPHIFSENQFDVHSIVDKVKPDSFVLAMGDNTGYGWHFDFFNGWKDGAIPGLLDSCPQGGFGNANIGDCPTFEKSNVRMDACKPKTTYKENVVTPGKALPGCNPISDANPAPYYDTAPLGTATTNCKLSGGEQPPSDGSPSKIGGASSSAASSAMPSGGASSKTGGASSQAASSSAAMSSSTLATFSKPTTIAKPTTAKPTTTAPKPTQTQTDDICPSANGKKLTKHGKTFKVECGIDRYGNDLKMVQASDLNQCISACAKTSGCVDVSLQGTMCYMKSSAGAKSQNSGVNGAKLVSSGGKHRHGKKHALH